ncbi:uncharacterized protein VP01_2062g1 [Puccinia sorghi]|uniref:Uncharacterized protein n=1 Tax=Puccinia sorghi TaxID=27349 RepID=A0A0L6VB86_9BASI|nr:uncharacterized protein VP01_2062g1 [Puccinia sorghi]
MLIPVQCWPSILLVCWSCYYHDPIELSECCYFQFTSLVCSTWCSLIMLHEVHKFLTCRVFQPQVGEIRRCASYERRSAGLSLYSVGSDIRRMGEFDSIYENLPSPVPAAIQISRHILVSPASLFEAPLSRPVLERLQWIKPSLEDEHESYLYFNNMVSSAFIFNKQDSY